MSNNNKQVTQSRTRKQLAACQQQIDLYSSMLVAAEREIMNLETHAKRYGTDVHISMNDHMIERLEKTIEELVQDREELARELNL